MTWYQSITPDSGPHGAGLHPATQRPIVSFTCRVFKTPSLTLYEEIVKILVDAGVGVFGTTIFAGDDVVLPAEREDPPFIHILESAGITDLRIHDDVSGYRRPSIVINAMAETDASARTLAEAAYAALHVIRNVQIVP